MEVTSEVFLVSATLIGLFLFGVVYFVNLIRAANDEVQKITPNPPQKKEKKRLAEQPMAQKQLPRKKQDRWTRDYKPSFSHPWVLTSLKGHSRDILDMDFSANGKFIASCGDDRSIFIWSTKDWNSSSHKYQRINVDFDHATHIRWSPDSKAFIIHKSLQNCLEVYKVGRKPDGWISPPTKATTFKSKHDKDIVGMDIAANGRFIMTCSEGTDLLLWDLKGRVMHQLDTLCGSTNMARISPCGRFIAVAGSTPDVKVWEANFTKTGELDKVERAFDLKAHSAGVLDFAFTSDSSKMATISEDGTWAVFDTDVDYEDEEEPILLVQEDHKVDLSVHHPCIALSPDGEVVAISAGNSLHLYLVGLRTLHTSIEDIFPGPITKILFDASGKFVLVCGNKHVRIFHNVPSYDALIANLAVKLRSPGLNSATKERLNNMLREAKSFLSKLGVESIVVL